MLKFPESDREIMSEVIDLHVHTMPSVYHRPFDVYELARQAREVGYRAILFKCHHAINADCTYLVRKLVPGIEAFGGVVLNHAVGGLNPEAVDAAIGLGAKEVWMPTMNSMNHVQAFGRPAYIWHKRVFEAGMRPKPAQGITVLVDGEVADEVREILGLIADSDIILGTGHLSRQEVFALLKAAREEGVKKMLVTHPEWEATHWSIEEQERMAGMGATLEHCLNSLMPFREASNPTEMVNAVKRVGVEKCVLATDFGQWRNPHPIEGMRHFIHLMMQMGFSKREIDVMTKENPARLLGIT